MIRKAYSIIEVILVVTILLVILGSFSTFGRRFFEGNIIDNKTSEIVSSLKQAQSNSVSGKAGVRWGVAVTSSPNEIKLYAEGDPTYDQVFTYPDSLTITNFDILFEKDTGNPTQTLNITVSDQSGNSQGIALNSLGTSNLASVSLPVAECGNAVCETSLGETCNSCSADCGLCCGNSVCEPAYGEDCNSCSTDCGSCGPVCGNAVCEVGEDCSSCSADCGSCGGSSLIAHWEMDDNVSGNGQTLADSTTNGYNLTTNWGANSSGMDCTATGRDDLSCDFDGDDSSSNTSITLPTDDFTYTAWINRDTLSGFDHIFHGSTTGGNDGFTIWITNSNNVHVRLDSTYNFESAGAITLNTWHHVGVTRSGSNIVIYIDGVADSNTGSHGNTLTLDDCLVIGADNDGDCSSFSLNEYFDGNLDELRIYDYALTSQEISDLYNSAPAPSSCSQYCGWVGPYSSGACGRSNKCSGTWFSDPANLCSGSQGCCCL